MIVEPKLLYISGPMAGMPDHNYPAFHSAAEQLRATGIYYVLNPAEWGVVSGWHWEDYIRRDLAVLMAVGPNLEGIATLADRPQSPSRGRYVETFVASEIGCRVQPLKAWLASAANLAITRSQGGDSNGADSGTDGIGLAQWANG